MDRYASLEVNILQCARVTGERCFGIFRFFLGEKGTGCCYPFGLMNSWYGG
jgi:hypothetical protein